MVTALAEIEELKQTLRYLEISLAKSKDEKEVLVDKVNKANERNEVCVCLTVVKIFFRKLSYSCENAKEISKMLILN